MIDLSSNALATPAKISSSPPAGNCDTQNNVGSAQGEDGSFHEELTREINALQERSPAAKEGEDKSAATESSKAADGKEDQPAQTDGASASTAPLLGGVVLLLLPVAAPAAATADADALMASLKGGGRPPQGVAAVSATAATSTAAASPADVGAGTAAARDMRLTSGDQENQIEKRPDTRNSISAHADAADGRRMPDFSHGEQAMAAITTAAESAASGKIRPEVRESIDALASPEPRSNPRPVSEAPLQFSLHSAGSAGTHNTALATAHAVASIPAHVASPAWDRSLGEKVVWMAGQHLQVAQLNLNPPELGPLQVTLTISANDQASAQFVSTHAAVREAIEAAMPRLREMLAEGGITLGNASVSADTFRDPSQTGQESRGHAARGAEQSDAGGEFRATTRPRLVRGLVDIFA